MGYFTRVFCRASTPPSPEQVEAALRTSWPALRFAPPAGADSLNWSDLEVFYKEGKQPICVEVRMPDTPDSLPALEVNEFLEELIALRRTSARDRAVAHLRASRFTVVTQLLSDIDDDGYELNGRILEYFAEHYDGLVQADGEGFYEGTELVIELR